MNKHHIFGKRDSHGSLVYDLSHLERAEKLTKAAMVLTVTLGLVASLGGR